MKKPKFTLQEGVECMSVMTPIGDGDAVHCIGEIYGTTFVTKRDPHKHTMRRWDAYGVNQDIIDSGLFDIVVFQEPLRSQMITVDDLKTFSRLEHPEGEEP